MIFQSPHYLWLLAPLILLFSWELARQTARRAATWPKIARAWAGAFQVSPGARHTTAETRPRLWLWFGLALCIVALARPQWGSQQEQVFDQSREVIIALDLSKSMLSQDVKPSRLDRSKLLIQSLLDGLKGERVGLELFAGTAFLQSPLSSDYEILREFLPPLNPAYLPEGGSNYKALLETALQAFGTSAADRYLIILSDGESTDDDWRTLGDELKQKGIRVIGLGVGTAQGAFIPDDSGGFLKDDRGAVVLSRLNSSTLEELAQVTGGAYTNASSWVDLPALLKKTVDAGRKGDFAEKNTDRMIERYQWFLAPGLLLLFISFWAEFPIRPRERNLPMRNPAGSGAGNPGAKTPALALGALFLLASLLNPPSPARAEENTGEVIAAPLAKTVARLADNATLSADDCAELAQATLSYGQRLKSAHQHPPESVINDGLQAVNLGEKLNARAADWRQLRQGLQELLKKEEPPKEQKKQDPKQQQKPQDKQQQKQDQKRDQQQNPKDQKNGEGQKSDQQQQSEPKPAGQTNQQQSAFGDMKDKSGQTPPSQPQPREKPGTQKVGGQQDNKPDAAEQNPELAIPLQKLEQVRDQDAPAKFQQLIQGQMQKSQPPAKDW